MYREELCTFCDATSRLHCPRCQAAVCSGHAPVEAAHCAMCAKELRDDLEIARFMVAVHDVPPDSGALFRSRGASLNDAVSWLTKHIGDFFARRRVERTFARRTPEQIAAWRRGAGVTTRA
jgi:hypothetical protein